MILFRKCKLIPLTERLWSLGLPPACQAGQEGEGWGWSPPRHLPESVRQLPGPCHTSPPYSGPWGGWLTLHVLSAISLSTTEIEGKVKRGAQKSTSPPKSSPFLPVNSLTIPANGLDYSSICSNLEIKTDKVKIFWEQCQAKGIKLLSDLYLSNGFMPFNNFKRNIMFFNTLF